MSMHLKGKAKTACGHLFRYVRPVIENSEDARDPQQLGRAVEVIMAAEIDQTGWVNAVTFPSAKQAASHTGVSNSEIGRICNNGGGRVQGLCFRWKAEATSIEDASLPVTSYVVPLDTANELENESRDSEAHSISSNIGIKSVSTVVKFAKDADASNSICFT